MKKLFLTAILILFVNIVYSETPVISMTTTIAKGNYFAVILASSTDNANIQIDWGDNIPLSYTIETAPQEIAGLLMGNTVKIYGSNIVYLNVNSKNLSNLDVSEATTLTDLYCSSNQLTKLVVSKAKNLVNLDCSSNSLANLDILKNKSLKLLFCSSNQLTTLDVTKNTELLQLYCSSNQIKLLDVSNNTKLVTLYCSSNLLGSLNLSSNTALASLYCFSNLIDTLDVSNNTELTNLWCFSNKLSNIDISKNLLLSSFNCSSNQLKKLDISKNYALTSLSCASNKLNFASLPVKASSWLSYLYSPQQTVKPLNLQYTVGENIDLSYLTSSVFSTVFTWKTGSGQALEAGTDYQENNGIFTFMKVQPEEIYCQMANPAFPDLMLKTEKINISAVTNIREISGNISIYPNPFVDMIHVESPDIIKKIELYNSTGKRLSEKTVENTAISFPFNNLSHGIYLMKVYSKGKISIHKIIKK